MYIIIILIINCRCVKPKEKISLCRENIAVHKSYILIAILLGKQFLYTKKKQLNNYTYVVNFLVTKQKMFPYLAEQSEHYCRKKKIYY